MRNPVTIYLAIHSLVSHAVYTIVSKGHVLLPLFMGISLLANSSRAQSFTWANKTTNTFQKTAVAADKSGNTYVLATFTDMVTVGNNTFTSLGDGDILLTKYNAAGVVQWSRQIGSTDDDESGDVTLTQSGGHVVVVGSFRSTVKFGNSTAAVPIKELTSTGSSDVFVARYSTSNGTLDWARKAGGATADFGYGIALDGSDNVYVTGSFTGTVNFKSGYTVISLVSKGSSDIFLIKYSKDGYFGFAKWHGGTGHDYGAAVAINKSNGDIYLTGGYSPVKSLSITDVFIAKYNNWGTFIWNKTVGSSATLDVGTDITASAVGVFITGYFGGTAIFDGTTLSSAGSVDAFVAHYRFDGLGTATWAKRFGGIGWDEGQSISYFEGNMYFGGTFTGTATFGETTVVAKGGSADRDMFLTRIAPSGTPGWTQRMGSSGKDYGRGGIAIPAYNIVNYTGHYAGAITLGSTTLSGSGNLLTKITLPTVTDFQLINAATDADLGTILSPYEINYMVIGTKQINIRANILNSSAGSVKFVLDGVTKTQNAAPFTWAGDEIKAGNVIDYFSFTPSLGNHKLEATPYSGPNGTGVKGSTRILTFTIADKPVLTGLRLINALTDKDVKPFVSGQTLYYGDLGTNQVNVLANTNPTTVGSVKFVLDGVAKIQNSAPYAYGGDTKKPDGSIDYKPVTFTNGFHRLVVTAYSGANATGTPSNVMDVEFYVVPANTRIAAPEQEEVQPVSFTVSPNPFSERTFINFTATQDGEATVEVYNLQGTLIERLYQGKVESGKSYRWEFNAKQLPTGLYIGRIQAGSQVVQQKMMLAR